MSSVFILIEQALGYCILKVKHCKSSEDLIVLLQDKNFDNVKSKIRLAEFQPFSSVNNASLNCQDIANGNANEDLIDLLRRHLSHGRCILVVSDKKLLESLKMANINEFLEFNGDSSMVMHLRRVRFSIHEFMMDQEEHLLRAHIGLGHSFSRMKIKYNINRSDNMIIQSINLLDQLDKDINTMSMRLREWFGYHYPELVKLAPDNRAYCTIVGIIGSRAGAVEGVLERLESVVGDTSRANQIISNAKTSMGYELTEEDFMNIGYLARKVLSMMNQRESTAKYLASKMSQVAPNFSTLVGDIVAARLISHAGSLINLAKFPASTIQILGAEKALFRALKTRTNTPKYGLIFHCSFIGRAAKNDKGRISRFLAAKISLAVRLDCFMEEPMNIFGLHLKKQVENQLKYLETGEEPQKNYEAMEAAVKDAKRYIAEMKSNRDNIDPDNGGKDIGESLGRCVSFNRDGSLVTDIKSESAIEPERVSKQSKKKKNIKKEADGMNEANVEDSITVEVKDKSKKKNKRKLTDMGKADEELCKKVLKAEDNLVVMPEIVNVVTEEQGTGDSNKKMKKKKKKVSNTHLVVEKILDESEKKSKKNKIKVNHEEEIQEKIQKTGLLEKPKKKGKKRSAVLSVDSVSTENTKEKTKIGDDEIGLPGTVEAKSPKKKNKKSK